MSKAKTKRIGLIADTHSHVDSMIVDEFSGCDEIWHAGDFGSTQVVDELEAAKPMRGVFGNIDDKLIRQRYPEDLRFEFCGVDILMTHIAGYPGRYNPRVRKLLAGDPPQLLICGHSHILRLDHDKKHGGLLCLNPGAAGHHGFHLIRTIMIAEFAGDASIDLTIIELGNRGARKDLEAKRVELGVWKLPKLPKSPKGS